MQPQIVVRVRFGRADDNERPQERAESDAERSAPRLVVTSLDASLGSVQQNVAVTTNRLSMRLPGVRLEFFVNDQVGTSQDLAAAEAQFATLDVDKNGYLDADEATAAGPTLGFPLEAIDTDEDGKAYLEEVRDFMVWRQAAYRNQVRARVADHADAMFSTLDEDGDGRLSAREIARSSRRLAGLDLDGNGKVGLAEIPGSMVIGIVRGNPQQADALFTLPTAVWENPDPSVPAWFLRMDVNADGDISPREFLGTSEQFRQLDVDRDGFLSPAEAAATESG